MANILITGGSRGLGHGFSLGVPNEGDKLWLVSRNRPKSLDQKDRSTGALCDAALQRR